MDKPDNQNDIWAGDGPQASAPSPAVICQFESAPNRCTFPDCGCSDIPGFLRRVESRGDAPRFSEGGPTRSAVEPEAAEAINAGQLRAGCDDTQSSVTPIDKIADDIADTVVRLNEALGASTVTTMVEQPDRRAPKRDRAAYMRAYRAQRKAAVTQ